jgi:DNA-binding response OmpR family regulator
MSKTTKPKIAVIEDSDFTRKSIINALEKAGYEVSADAKNAQEAYQAIQSSHADLFIIDVVMPEVSGIELAKKINEDFSNSRIIMMSSLNLESVVIESISSGAVDFLSKPFDMADLIKAVEKVEQEMKNDR